MKLLFEQDFQAVCPWRFKELSASACENCSIAVWRRLVKLTRKICLLKILRLPSQCCSMSEWKCVNLLDDMLTPSHLYKVSVYVFNGNQFFSFSESTFVFSYLLVTVKELGRLNLLKDECECCFFVGRSERLASTRNIVTSASFDGETRRLY